MEEDMSAEHHVKFLRNGAAHARSLDLNLVTDNFREFSRVDGLKIENWLEMRHD
jgi:hypothetical protein